MRYTRLVFGGWLQVLMLAALLGLAGCTQEPGQANPTTTTQSRAGETSARTVPPTSGSAFAQFDACGIFTATEREQYDLPKGKRPDVSTNPRDCTWQVRDDSFGAEFSIHIQQHGVDDIQADAPPEPIQVNGREAVQWTSSGGTLCAITFGYGPQQTIDIYGTVGYAEDDSITECDVVKKFAKIVQPKLPERN